MTRMMDFVIEKIERLDEDLFDVDGDIGRMKLAASPVQPHEIKKMIAQGKGLRLLVGAGKMKNFMAVWVGDSDSNVGAMHETVADQFSLSMMDRHVPLELTKGGRMQLTTTAIGIFDSPREVEDILDRNSEYKTLFGTYKVDYRKLREAEEFQPESIAVGDEILAGKFKNSKRVVKGFKTDKHGQPVLKTDRGDTQLFKPRIARSSTNESWVNTSMRLMEFTKLINTGRFLTERDVVNAPAIKQWAIQAAQRVQDSTARAWFQSQVYDYLVNRTEDRAMVQPVRQLPADAPEWLVKKIEMGSPVFQVTPRQEFAAQAQSVSDWVNAWAAENPGSRVNYTWEQAVKASEEWHQDLARGASHGAEDPADPGLIQFMTFPDGYRWVMVQSPQCLKREGGRMGHCVGGYHEQVTSGETVILSLRSPQNTPHCTIEVNKPDSTFWTAVVSTAAARAAEQQRKAENPGQLDLDLGDAVGNLPQSQSLGEINQIKGKQNKPPVPKYIPYVKALMDQYPFTISSYGSSDLENIGYYYRDGKIVGLKDVAKVFRKYPNGTAWVSLTTPDWGGQSSTRLKLVDKNWTPMVGLKIDGANGPAEDYSINSWISVSGDGMAYRDQMLDLVRTWKGKTDSAIAVPLYQHFNIFMGHDDLSDRQSDGSAADLNSGFKFGTPDEVTTPISVPDTDLQIYRMINHGGSLRHGKTDATDYIYESGTEVGAVIVARTTRGNTIDYIQMETSTSIPLPKILLGVSKAIGLPPKDPELLGLQPDGSVDAKEQYGEEILTSPGGEYTFIQDNADHVWVFEDDHDVPLARIREIHAYPRVESGLYSTDYWSDGGLLGYFLLCLAEEGILGKTFHDESGHDYGWAQFDGEWWYVAGADKIRVTESTTDHEGNSTGPTEITLGDIDESITGSEFSSQSYIYGSIISNHRFRYMDERYDDDENEVGVEYYWELVPGQDVQYLSFDDYYYDFVKQLQATGKIR